jgi:hypothetical protein
MALHAAFLFCADASRLDAWFSLRPDYRGHRRQSPAGEFHGAKYRKNHP